MIKPLIAIVAGALLSAGCVSGPPPPDLELRISCGLPDDARSLQRGIFHGRKALRFSLDQNDRGHCTADIARGDHNRVELRSRFLGVGQNIEIGFSVFIPKPFPASDAIYIGQFHQSKQKPLILLGASAKQYRVAAGSGLRALGAKVTRNEALFTAADYGRWQPIVMQARFSTGPDGFIRVYGQGKLAFEALGRTVETEPYFKIGLYGRADRIKAPLVVFVSEPVLRVY